MELSNLQTGVWLVPWPWWVLIGLAAGGTLLLGWSCLASAKEADKYILKEHQRRSTDRAKRNGIGRP